MLLAGLPYTEPAVARTQRGGGPYGASHVAGDGNSAELDDDEQKLAQLLGRRVAGVAAALAAGGFRDPAGTGR